MHRNAYPLLSLLFASSVARAQTTSPIINRADMPAVTAAAPVDTLRQSQAAATLPASAPPLSRRGANQTWNYAALVPTAQTVDRYVAVSATAPFYQLAFGVLGGVNRATVASPEALPLGTGLALPITDPYQFYNVAAATASVQDYRSVGFGGTLAGVQVPVSYRSQAEQDVIYRFPLSFASAPDSSTSYLETPAAAAATGYFNRKRKRVNKVDAWGTLVTPFGSFQTVRVVTKLTDHDSVAFGGTPGFGFDVPVTREYKWLAKNQHVPVLTITTTVVGGQETITAVQYRDAYRRIVPTATRESAALTALTVYPNPLASGPLRLTGLPGSAAILSVTDLTGRRLLTQSITAGQREATIPATAFGAFHGVALLQIQTAEGVAVRRIVRE
jgi:hypothetical protein